MGYLVLTQRGYVPLTSHTVYINTETTIAVDVSSYLNGNGGNGKKYDSFTVRIANLNDVSSTETEFNILTNVAHTSGDSNSRLYNNSDRAGGSWSINNNLASLTFILPRIRCSFVAVDGSFHQNTADVDRAMMIAEGMLFCFYGTSSARSYATELIFSEMVKISLIPMLTPLYLGKAQTDSAGNFMFNDAMLTSDAAYIQGNQLTTADWVNQQIDNIYSRILGEDMPMDYVQISRLRDLTDDFGYVKMDDLANVGAKIGGNFRTLVTECNKLRQDVAALSGLLLGQDITNGATLVGSQDGATVTFTAPKVDALEIGASGDIEPVAATQAS